MLWTHTQFLTRSRYSRYSREKWFKRVFVIRERGLFRGHSSINLDVKGHLAIPTRYRSKLQACCVRQLVATVAVARISGEDGYCLWLYPLPEWEKLEEKLGNLSTLDKGAISLCRFIIAYTAECEMDGQGRVLLSETLRTYVNLEKQIILLGQLNKFEIWNKTKWSGKQDECDVGEPTEQLASIPF